MDGRTIHVGSIYLGGFGLVLGLAMLYTLVFEGIGGCATTRQPEGQVEVSVLYLERSEWRIFARGAKLCCEGSRPMGRVVAEEDDTLLIETTRGRRVRFMWRGVRGEGQAREVLHDQVRMANPPIAIIGSSNTVLTSAIAGQLRLDGEGRPGGGPLLLVPWATSVSLLDLYPGRTFRFCANNHHEAAMVVDCLKAQPGAVGPSRVVMVVDPLDPYSIDLAQCFKQEIGRAFPKATIEESDDTKSVQPRLSGRSGLPSASDQQQAREVWRRVTDGPKGETWVVLPLQNNPARRMLVALNGAAPGRQDPQGHHLTVLCGDAIGETTLSAFIHQLVFPVWSVTTASNPAEGGLDEDVHEQAEVVAALLIGIDQGDGRPTPDSLRETLLRPVDKAPSPFGRSLAFMPGGERQGFSSGGTFSLLPESTGVVFRATGRWNEPRPINAPGLP